MHSRIALILCLTCLLVGSAAWAAPDSLIPNGNFEKISNPDRGPDGWPSTRETIAYPTENGNTFMRLQISEAGQTAMAYLELPISPDARALQFSYRVRYRDIKVGAKPWFDGRIMMHFKGVGGKKLKPAPPTPYFRGTRDKWQTRTSTFLVPEGARLIEFMPSLLQAKSGTLEFDDFRLTPMSSQEAEQMLAKKEAAAALKAERETIIKAELTKPAVTKGLKVVGNQVLDADGNVLWLQGLSVDSMQWSMGENILWSIHTAINDWNANVIRLPVKASFWFGRDKNQGDGAEEAYRQTVDQAVQLCAANGAYLVLDLHHFGAPMDRDVEFWADAAERYKNNPAVLFELFNEPHGISWKVWRDGGDLRKDKHQDENVAENTLKQKGTMSVGVQALVDTVRSTGAQNTLVVAGLDWGYDLTGIMNGYALDDRGGDGIIYVSHIYPWKSNWKGKVLVAAEKHPIILTEMGAIEKWSDFKFIPASQHKPLEGFAEDLLGFVQKNKLHWTGFSFHPRCGPMVISDWDYTPTSYWGVYVKKALEGKTFELKRMR